MTTSTTTAGTTMRAIIQENYGEAENVLRLGQAGRPAIGDQEVLLRVHAAGVDRAIDKIYPLSQTIAAIRYMRDGHARGKVVINISDASHR